ncbi:nuclear transport factor 2 family protein [Ancylobacter sp. A5.8]|uniref:nuclear transport factor 2 family protein n=1 Tax=Ancylobacter gelatini TaxID=2919920 RepID=UPI001F4DF61C|nr:nuclear transport factor 2 family protein [Ancylobacter gelatini]MCJ8143753.1 nuclear transport factor 2 family protein [Ancylobacter gelatini]
MGTDAAGLLETNLDEVWNERDPARRLAALSRLYHPDAVLYEPDREVTGHEAISETVGALLGQLPEGFRFEPVATPLEHHGLALARWRGGPPGQVIVTGSDVARVADGLITELHVFIDPPPVTE